MKQHQNQRESAFFGQIKIPKSLKKGRWAHNKAAAINLDLANEHKSLLFLNIDSRHPDISFEGKLGGRETEMGHCFGTGKS